MNHERDARRMRAIFDEIFRLLWRQHGASAARIVNLAYEGGQIAANLECASGRAAAPEKEAT